MRYNYLKGKLVRSLILFISLSEASYVYAQAQESGTRITGVVRDNFGKPLPGARINVENTQLSALSDSSGNFSIAASGNSRLLISHEGFDATLLSAGGKTKLDVQLLQSYLQHAQKVTLLHKNQNKDELLQSVSTVYTNQLVTTPAPSFLQALPGRLSGLYTRQRSGVQDNDDPASVIDFRIRGQNPIILIDGVPRDFSSIEPESIESISVLKDALSAVMYGQRSSNNIILVTTKRPVTGPFKLSATVQRGAQSLINLPRPVSAADYAILYNEARANDGQDRVYSAADIAAYKDGSDPYGHPDINWQDAFLNEYAAISRYNLNIQSGTNNARFWVALDYQNEGGFYKTADINTYSTNSSVDRYIIRSNVSVDLNKTLNVGMNIFGRIQNANQPGNGNSSVFNAIETTPNNAYSLFNPDGSLGGNSRFTNNIYGSVNNSGYISGTTRDLSADLELTQKLEKWMPGLWVKGNVSYNNTVDQQVNRSKTFAVFNFTAPGTYQQIGTNGSQSSAFSFSSRRTYTYFKLSSGFDRSFGDNNLHAVVLADRQSTTLNLNLPATYINYAANVNYNYKEKYFAEAAASYGGFNRYKPGDQYGLFYAGGIGWDLARENFLEGKKWINTLKPRISYGRTGYANVGYYVYEQYYDNTGTSNVYYFGGTGSGTGARGYMELALANPDVTWEKANKLDAGVDLALFHNRLKLSSEYFNDTYFDLMQTRGTSSQLIGQAYPQENIGKNRYWGFENDISWQSNKGQLNYFIAANISALQSKVLYQDEVYRQYDYEKRTGRPVGQAFGYIAQGFFQSQEDIQSSIPVEGYNPVPGDIKYKDMNNDGIINQRDEAPIGTQKPLIYYGLTTGFRIKGFDLSVSFQGVANRDIILSGALEYEFQNSGNGQAFEQHLYRWTPNNAAGATYPRLSVGTNSNNQRNSTFWVHSADYLRLQNVDLGYTLPASLTRKLRVNAVRIFANGFNLYSFDSLDHNDPENNNSIYPLRRTFNAGINIKL